MIRQAEEHHTHQVRVVGSAEALVDNNNNVHPSTPASAVEITINRGSPTATAMIEAPVGNEDMLNHLFEHVENTEVEPSPPLMPAPTSTPTSGTLQNSSTFASPNPLSPSLAPLVHEATIPARMKNTDEDATSVLAAFCTDDALTTVEQELDTMEQQLVDEGLLPSTTNETNDVTTTSLVEAIASTLGDQENAKLDASLHRRSLTSFAPLATEELLVDAEGLMPATTMNQVEDAGVVSNEDHIKPAASFHQRTLTPMAPPTMADLEDEGFLLPSSSIMTGADDFGTREWQAGGAPSSSTISSYVTISCEDGRLG